MIFDKKINKYAFWLPFLAGMVLIFFALGLQLFFSYRNDPGKITRNFQTVLRDKEKQLTGYLGELKKSGRKSFSPVIINAVKYNKLYDETGLALFVYQNDSLLYWSTNEVPFSIQANNKESFSVRVEKLRNGWYEIIRMADSIHIFEGYILIRHEYPFENDYLRNRFQKDFPIDENATINLSKGKYNIWSNENKFLFSIEYPAKISLSGNRIFFLLILYLAGFLFLILSMYKLYSGFQHMFPRKWLFLSGFILDVSILRFILFYFRIPQILYNSDLFGPEYYSSSVFLPSLGDFLVNSILILVLAYFIYKHFPAVVFIKWKKPIYSYLLSFFAGFIILGGLVLVLFLTRDLIFNSTIPFNLQNILNLNLNSVLGFVIIATLFLSYFLIAYRMMGIIAGLPEIKKSPYLQMKITSRLSLTRIVIFLLFFSVIATIALNRYNDSIEKEKRKILALQIATERDPVAEMLFTKMEAAILNDSLLISLGSEPSFLTDAETQENLLAYLQQRYFNDYWNNYFIQFTFCSNQKLLRIQPQNYLISCETYFQNTLKDFGKSTASNHLYFLDYGFGNRNYLAVLPVLASYHHALQVYNIYIEISSRLVFKDLGYPELLIDKQQNRVPDITGYSYALYRNGKLIHRVGKYNYSLEIDHTLIHPGTKTHFYVMDGMNHFCYPVDEKNILIISKKESSILDKMAPFSYLFFFFAFFCLIFYLLVKFPHSFSLSFLRLETRLQVSMISILLASFLIIGFLIIYYIIRLNSDKNLDNLSERTHSLLVELQHKLGPENNLDTLKTEYLNELLIKFSNVFFTDVNLYDPRGSLLATSRPQVFEAGLIAGLMNSEAFSVLNYSHSSLFIHNESIGLHSYYSAYIPFFSEHNKLLAYLNLPYFARQDDMKREISTFLVAFINIYVFLIIIGIFTALVVSSYISRPIRLLTSRIGTIMLGKTNEKLVWKRRDEIGKLVEEYNRMIDELARSAEMLARSERESAWREMAQQIAHEIKNPLTPMKLSVQYLQKSWEEKGSEWDSRLKRFTETMIEQIESLSEIASEFSDFAKMPVPQNEKLELTEIVNNVAALYHDLTNISIHFNPEVKGFYIWADRKQIMRVFNNLIINSIQAIGNENAGIIEITIKGDGIRQFIEITDNGSGISREQAERIFQPNFTTKSGGMGLGLAIVKSIIEEAGGSITFESIQGKGTTFRISFPVYE